VGADIEVPRRGARRVRTPSGDIAFFRPGDGAIGPAVLHRHPIREHSVEGAIACFDRRALGPSEPAEGFFDGFGGEVRVQARESIPQSLLKEDLSVVPPFRAQRVRRNIRPVLDRPVQGFEPGEGGVFYNAFSETNHGIGLAMEFSL